MEMSTGVSLLRTAQSLLTGRTISLLGTFQRTLVSYITWTLISFHVSFKDAWIQEFLSGGSRPGGEKTAWTTFFVLSLFYSFRGGKWFYCRENYTFSRIQRGPTFSKRWGSNFFQWGCPNANFYRNSYNLWYSRGCCWSGSPTPLWIRTW